MVARQVSLNAHHQMGHSRISSLGVACAVLGVVTTCGLTGVLPMNSVQVISANPPKASMEASETLDRPFPEVLPFIIVVTAYALQSLIALLCMGALSSPMHHNGSLAFQLVNVRHSLRIFLLISTFGLAVYAYFAFASGRFLCIQSLDGGPHLGLRNIFWMLSTPGQWGCFAKSLTTASDSEISRILTATIAMQAFGMASLAQTSLALHLAFIFCGCVSFAVMFHAGLRLPLLEEFKPIAVVALNSELVTWGSYPVILIARTMGWIDPWTEQVLIYSILDIVTKTIMLSAILTTQFHIMISGAEEALQALERHASGGRP